MVTDKIQTSISEHSVLYDIIVPESNLLRRINALIDFSFVYEELTTNYCHDNGRMAQNPIILFKYLLLKVIFDLSDVDVVERSLYDMSFKYFLGMSPEETQVINPSTLSKFRKLRLKDVDLLNLLIEKTVTIAIDKGIIKSKSIIVDSTHSLSRSNPCVPVDILKLRSKQLRKTLYAIDDSIKDKLPAKNMDNNLDNELKYTQLLIDTIKTEEVIVNYPKVKERLNMLKESIEDIHDHYTTSIKDGDARLGHKTSDTVYFGYKTHIAMTEERIITAATVTSGEKGDGPQLPELIEQSHKNGMKDIDTIIGDTAYSGNSNLEEAKKKDIKIVAKLSPSISHGARSEADKFEYNKDAGMFVCPAGHLAIRKAKKSSKSKNKNQRIEYYFDIKKCKLCSKRDGCYKEGAKTKGYSISIKTEEQNSQIEFQDSEYFKDKIKERYKIEAKNAELKHVFGYDRAKSYGLSCMQMQGAITIFASNVKRILKLM